MLKDLKYAARGLVRQPAFTLAAVGALAIGIGANSAIFSVVNGVVLKPLPFRDSSRLAVVLEKNTRTGSVIPVAPANFYDVQAQSRSFETVGGAEAWSAALTGTDGPPEMVIGLRMSGSMFELLGVPPMLGRTFGSEAEEPGRHRVVVLSHKLWQRRFGADPRVVGKSITLRGEPYEVAGVMPADFRFPPFWATRAEMWAPLVFPPERKASRSGQSIRVFARLKKGVSLEQAQTELSAMGQRFAAAYPETNTNGSFEVSSLHDKTVGKVRPALMLLLGGVGFVLLIACANVANLLLARSIGRRKEMAVRLAIGAGRRQIVRQLLTESVLLAFVGGAAGLLLAFYGVEGLQRLLADTRTQNTMALPRIEQIALDPAVLLFTAILSAITGVLFGLAPALSAARGDVNDVLKESGRGMDGSRTGIRFGNALVAAQVALTLMLLVGAGLMIRSFSALMDVDPGFRADRVLTAVVNSGGSSIAAGQAQVNFYRDLLQRISSSPGVVSAAAINHLPLAGDVWGTSFVLEDRPEPAPGERFAAVYRVVSPGYFPTIGAIVTRGRDFTDTDRAHGEPVALINEAMARRFWPGQDPVGKRLRMGRNDRWSTVVGLVRDVKQREWAANPDPEIYISYLQHPDHFSSPWSSSMTLVVRTAEDPASFVKTLQAAASSIHRNIPVSDIATLDQVVTDSVRQPRVFALLLGIFACAALLLAAIGIYGVISYTVSQRMHDMGIRVALGAAPGDLLRHVLGQGGRMIAAGLVIGVLGSLALSRAMSTLLFGVQPNDVPTYAAVSSVLMVIGLAASYVPARRAAAVDPVTALRQM